MSIELVNCESVILKEIVDKNFTRDDIAKTYAMIIRSTEKINWSVINSAIIDRWSMSAIGYIKVKAYKLLKGED